MLFDFMIGHTTGMPHLKVKTDVRFLVLMLFLPKSSLKILKFSENFEVK